MLVYHGSTVKVTHPVAAACRPNLDFGRGFYVTTVKEQAENILDRLGVPASVVINALYKQIIYRNGIPFSLVLPTAPVARDEMTDAEFNAMMQTGLNAAKADRSRGASEVFADLRRGL